jgi:predicted FMN-binding regulatory protein PaiB
MPSVTHGTYAHAFGQTLFTCHHLAAAAAAAGTLLDVKKSSHKKMSKFLQVRTPCWQLLQAQQDTSVLSVLAARSYVSQHWLPGSETYYRHIIADAERYGLQGMIIIIIIIDT